MPTFSGRPISVSPVPTPALTRPNSPLSNLVQHPHFYLPGGDLFIQIDTTLFSVHKYFFIRESPQWIHFLRRTDLGTTARNPVILVNEFAIDPPPTVNSFSDFLWVFYNPDYPYHNVPIRTWLTIEVYAAYFQMQNVLHLVDRELHILTEEHRHRQQSSTTWQVLSVYDGSDNPSTSTNDDHYKLSEEPYENWITQLDVEEDVSLLLNRPHLLDGSG